MTTHKEQSRNEFEAHFKGADFARIPGGYPRDYAMPQVESLWVGWQAARATPAQTAVAKMLETNQLDELGREVARLQRALCFWLPSVTEREDEVADRILQDAFLLCGIDGNIPDDFKTAQELGWISLAGAKPSPSSVGAAIRALPLPEPVETKNAGYKCDPIKRYDEQQMRALLSEAAALAEQVQGQRDTERMSLLQAETVDTIYLDDGRIIDVGGKHAGNLRDAIDAFAAPSIAQDGQEGNHG